MDGRNSFKYNFLNGCSAFFVYIVDMEGGKGWACMEGGMIGGWVALRLGRGGGEFPTWHASSHHTTEYI